MTITKADPNSPFWTACREACERHERKVTAEQELAELRRGLRVLADIWHSVDTETEHPDDFTAGTAYGLSGCAMAVDRLLARKPGAQ